MLGANLREIASTANVAFLLAFPSLFSIINPIGGALIFNIYTRGFAHAVRLDLAKWVGFYSLLVMFGALWGGTYVLSFFGVSIDALRIAGGTVVALSGWQLLTSGEQHPDRRNWARGRGGGRRSRPAATGVLSPDPAVHHGARHDRGRDHARRRAAARWRQPPRLLRWREHRRRRQRGDHLDRLSLRRPGDGVHWRDRSPGRGAALRLPPDVHRRADPGDRGRRPRRQMAGRLRRPSAQALAAFSAG